MKILITGGAGYIGSHVVKLLLENTDHDLTIIDNLSTGKIETINQLKKIAYAKNQKIFHFYEADLNNFIAIEKIFLNENFDAILHFAASIVVPDSIKDPLQYYSNNTLNTINLIQCAIKHSVKYFIFSSTAAVYGEPKTSSVKETAPTQPINPYGKSKLMSEIILQDTADAHPDFKFVILRYFNVAGASIDNQIGQSFPNATHLIKIASECATGKRPKMFIFGENYPTPDGTCIRDYIHIEDLSLAHIAALNYLVEGNSSNTFNCGYGKGYSVKEVIDEMKKISPINFNVEIGSPRAGDSAQIIADNEKILSTLQWQPKYNDLSIICHTAYAWETKISENKK